MVVIRELGHALDRFDEAASRAMGLGRSDLRALNVLEHGPLPSGEIAARLGLTTGSVTALVDRLIQGGYVSRHPSLEDRRKVLIQLEPATYAAFARVYAPCGQAVAAVGAQLPARQVRAARETLEAVVAAIHVEEAKLRQSS